MEEIWKPIKNYEKLYEISNYGNIKSLIYKKEKILKPYMTSTGYYKIDLRKNNIRKIRPIHKLVAETFIDNPNNLSEVNHKDGDKTNNKVWNLEWVTRSDNIKHSYRTGLHIHIPDCKPVNQIDVITGKIIKTYKSINDAAKQLNLRHESISACAKGITNCYGGYKWEILKSR